MILLDFHVFIKYISNTLPSWHNHTYNTIFTAHSTSYQKCWATTIHAIGLHIQAGHRRNRMHNVYHTHLCSIITYNRLPQQNLHQYCRIWRVFFCSLQKCDTTFWTENISKSIIWYNFVFTWSIFTGRVTYALVQNTVHIAIATCSS